MGHEAYLTISDKNKRKIYDKYGVLIIGSTDIDCVRTPILNKKDVEKLISEGRTLDELITLDFSNISESVNSLKMENTIEDFLANTYSIGRVFSATKDYKQVRKNLLADFDSFLFDECGDDLNFCIYNETGGYDNINGPSGSLGDYIKNKLPEDYDSRYSFDANDMGLYNRDFFYSRYYGE